MPLGNDREIIPYHSRRLIDNLEARGFEVAEIDMSKISKTSGGIH
jgi:N-dimethylarginine dimethylaminohydrolase|tara:strand:- start:1009 stop:1143 length:135 start_codon:yes stop_codon:yes gene_type:complete